MSRRWILLLAFAAVAAAQQAPAEEGQPSPAPSRSEEQAPPEEDESSEPKEYSFNPLQAAKELRIGNYYFKQGNYRAASLRFQEATKWDNTTPKPSRLGEAREKQHDKKARRRSVRQVSGARARREGAPEVKKRLERLK